ncbi:cadherin-87A-like [Littorina saxatilis]|uniref:cadherin-87A-like n=1 Tax=Littorina saxatilis TaxID=31220 RepID=UPI0038B5FA6D
MHKVMSGYAPETLRPRRVVVARDLRREPVTSHELTIGLSDGHTHITCTVFIVLNNKNSPAQFAPHTAVVPVKEDVPALTSLFKFDVTTNDTYSLTWNVEPFSDVNFFHFDDEAYEVRLAEGHSFDYETKTRKFVITCTADDRFLQSSSSVTISIVDVNDPPYFVSPRLHVAVDEGPAPTVSFLPHYNVLDPDNDTLSFGLVGNRTTSDNGLFTINAETGELTNRLALDRDQGKPNPLQLQVEVKDQAGTSATVDVIVFLNDVNDNDPEFAQPTYAFKVGLSSTQGTLMGTIWVTDKDDGSNGHVELSVTRQSPSGYMTLEADGRLYLTRDLDLEYGTLVSLHVQAADRGHPPRTATVIVDVVWNEGPKIHNLPTVAYVHESATRKTAIFDLSVTDPESDQYTCTREDITPLTKAFDVEETGDKDFKVVYTGSDNLASSVHRKYVMTIRCHDDNGEVSKKLSIGILNNAAPVLPCSPIASVTVDAADTEVDNSVYVIHADDAENDTLEYVISPSPFFYVGRYSGVIKARTSLRTATTDQYAVSVSVLDPKHTAYCTVIIHLTHVNRAPIFSNLDHTIDIPEHTAGGSTLYVISVIDSDIFDSNIDVTWTADNRHKFDVTVSGLTVTVKLRADAVLDYESTERRYVLKFTASDHYLASEEKTLTILVAPVNEPPRFANNVLSYAATFREISTLLETKALGCRAQDPDEKDSVTLTLSGLNANLFRISNDGKCELTLISEFDLDNGLMTPATLTLVATDNHGEKNEATVIVTIVEVNDNAPVFRGPVWLTVGRAMRAGERVGEVVATDRDQGTNGVVSFSVLSSSTTAVPLQPRDYFTFSSTGHFTLRQSFDATLSSGENFRYVIKASDYGVPPRTATTTVNIIYDPSLSTTTTTTSTRALTSTVSSRRTTSAMGATSGGSDDILKRPLVIGLVSVTACLGAMLAALAVYLAVRFCGHSSTTPSGASNYVPTRPVSSVKNNRVSVTCIDTRYNDALDDIRYDGRKITSIVPLPGEGYF